jgi:hypothetical protein
MTQEEELALGKELALYAGDPLRFVLEDMVPWDSDPQLNGE